MTRVSQLFVYENVYVHAINNGIVTIRFDYSNMKPIYHDVPRERVIGQVNVGDAVLYRIRKKNGRLKAVVMSLDAV